MVIVTRTANPQKETQQPKVAKKIADVPTGKAVRRPTHEARSFTLRRAFGTGFGTGEMLVKLKRGEPIEVLATHLPVNLKQRHFTKPWDQREIMIPEVWCKHGSLAIAVVTANTITPARFALEHMDGNPIHPWRELDPETVLIKMTPDQEAQLSAFTGMVATWKRKREARRPAGLVLVRRQDEKSAPKMVHQSVNKKQLLAQIDRRAGLVLAHRRA